MTFATLLCPDGSTPVRHRSRCRPGRVTGRSGRPTTCTATFFPTARIGSWRSSTVVALRASALAARIALVVEPGNDVLEAIPDVLPNFEAHRPAPFVAPPSKQACLDMKEFRYLLWRQQLGYEGGGIRGRSLSHAERGVGASGPGLWHRPAILRVEVLRIPSARAPRSPRHHRCFSRVESDSGYVGLPVTRSTGPGISLGSRDPGERGPRRRI
jgi:hypothetical protein